MWRALTVWAGRSDKVFVAWVALALSVAFTVSASGLLSLTEGVQEGAVCSASSSQQDHDANKAPSTPGDEPTDKQVDVSEEDDEVFHYSHHVVLIGLRLEN